MEIIELMINIFTKEKQKQIGHHEFIVRSYNKFIETQNQQTIQDWGMDL